MSEERIGDKFLRKLYEKTENNRIDSIERDEIGKEIRVLDDVLDNRELEYCARSKKQGWDSFLGERMYVPRESIPHDHDLWKQCHDCGRLVPIYEVKKEAKLLC